MTIIISGADNWKPANGERGSGFSFQVAVMQVEKEIDSQGGRDPDGTPSTSPRLTSL